MLAIAGDTFSSSRNLMRAGVVVAPHLGRVRRDPSERYVVEAIWPRRSGLNAWSTLDVHPA